MIVFSEEFMVSSIIRFLLFYDFFMHGYSSKTFFVVYLIIRNTVCIELTSTSARLQASTSGAHTSAPAHSPMSTAPAAASARSTRILCLKLFGARNAIAKHKLAA